MYNIFKSKPDYIAPSSDLLSNSIILSNGIYVFYFDQMLMVHIKTERIYQLRQDSYQLMFLNDKIWWWFNDESLKAVYTKWIDAVIEKELLGE